MIMLMSVSPSEVVSVLTKQKIAELKAKYGPRIAKYAIELRHAAKELLQAESAAEQIEACRNSATKK